MTSRAFTLTALGVLFLAAALGTGWAFRSPALVLSESVMGGPAEIPRLVAYRDGTVFLEDRSQLKPRFYGARLTAGERQRLLVALGRVEPGPPSVITLDRPLQPAVVTLVVWTRQGKTALRVNGLRTVPGWKNRSAYQGFSMSDYERQIHGLEARGGRAWIPLISVVPILKMSHPGTDPWARFWVELWSKTP